MRSTGAVGVAGLLALACAGAPAAPAPHGSDEAQQALAVRGIAQFYGVGQQRGLLWCVSLCEQGRCASPSPQFVARFAHEQYRVNDPGHCTWRDGRVTYSGRASAQLGAQQLDLRTPPRGALYLDVGPASGCTGQECTVTAKLTVGPGTTRVLLVNLENRTGDWRVQGIEEQRPLR